MEIESGGSDILMQPTVRQCHHKKEIKKEPINIVMVENFDHSIEPIMKVKTVYCIGPQHDDNIADCCDINVKYNFPVIKCEPCWDNGEVGMNTAMKQEPVDNGVEVQDVGIIEENPECSDVVKKEPLEPEFISVGVDGSIVKTEVNPEMSMDPFPDGGDCNFNSRKELEVHHTTKYKCETCGAVFHSIVLLHRHKQSDVGCSYSNNQIVNSNSCVRNVEQVCGVSDKPPPCKMCGKTFNTRKYMLSHTKSCGIQHKCDTCDKTFKQRQTMLTHKYDCDRQEPYKCEKCNKTYKLKRTMMSHIMYDCGRQDPHKCETCGKTFGIRNTMVRHMKNECIQQEPHKCRTCDKTFKLRKSLLAHVKHDCGRLEPHKCDRCSRTFKVRNSLLWHMKNDCGNL